MTDNKNNKKAAYYDVTIEGSKDTYQIELLNLRAKRDLVVKTSSLLAPALGSGADLYNEIKKQEELKALHEEEDLFPPEEETSLFSLSAVIGTQLDNPVVIEIMDKLMANAKKNGIHYDPDDYTDDEEFNRYLKLTSKSFEVNILNPLVRCLSEMGYSEIVGLAQTIMTTPLAKSSNDSKDS